MRCIILTIAVLLLQPARFLRCCWRPNAAGAAIAFHERSRLRPQVRLESRPEPVTHSLASRLASHKIGLVDAWRVRRALGGPNLDERALPPTIAHPIRLMRCLRPRLHFAVASHKTATAPRRRSLSLALLGFVGPRLSCFCIFLLMLITSMLFVAQKHPEDSP